MRRILTLVSLLVAACGGNGPTDPAGLSGTFDLQTIDGAGPPKIELINMSLDTLFYTGGELRVTSRGRMSVVHRRRWHSSSLGPFPEDPDTLVVTYREAAGSLFLDYPSTAPYGPYTDTATVSGDAITVRTKFHGLQFGTVIVRNQRYVRR